MPTRDDGYNHTVVRPVRELIQYQPILTPLGVRLAFAVAIATDLLQFLLGPIGWAFVDETLDLIAAFLTWRFLGFHLLLLPTFVLEFLPVTDLLPTWTGCVAVVVALRRRQAASMDSPGQVVQ